MLLTKRTLLAGAGAVTATSAIAQASGGQARVALETMLGTITLELASDKAPITAGNFMRYVLTRRLDGAYFYRAMRNAGAPDTGLIQGGVQGNPLKVLPPIAHESTLTTGLSHKDGVISLARYAPGTGTCEFFICIGDQPYLDANPNAPGDNQGFAAFGHVTDGMDVARKILAAPVSPTAGDGAMKGQMLDPVVTITSARVAT
jgi:peptidyl-prolyl cis-trans isomerase A (cyclophilin A)